MKTKSLLSAILLLATVSGFAQTDGYTIKTLFNNGHARASGGYAAMSNKFTEINGRTANIVQIHGGWYINHRFLLGIGVAGATNNIPVLTEHSADPDKELSYGYGQIGLMNEYVVHSDKALHIAFQLFTGAGYTTQYERHPSDDFWSDDDYRETHDDDWLFVAEPGVAIEMNIFRWMRFSPGVSYRAVYNASGRGLTDESLSSISYNLTLKFGKF